MWANATCVFSFLEERSITLNYRWGTGDKSAIELGGKGIDEDSDGPKCDSVLLLIRCDPLNKFTHIPKAKFFLCFFF